MKPRRVFAWAGLAAASLSGGRIPAAVPTFPGVRPAATSVGDVWEAGRPKALADTVRIDEWPVPWPRSRPRDPYVDARGRVWFVGQTGDYAAYLDPVTGDFRRYDLAPGTGPHNLIVDREGVVWYAGNRAAHIGRLDPESGEIRRYEMPDPAARDPHTLVFDAAGDIWFTVQGGNFVGKLEVATGKVRLVPMPTPRSRPYGIVVDATGRPWFTEFGTNKLGTVDPVTMEITEVELPRGESRPRRLALTSDGRVWYVDYAGGYLGRLDPVSGEIREWSAPGGAGAGPYGMTVDDRDRVWFVESGPRPNRLVGFDTRAREFFSVTEIPSGGGTVRQLYFHPPSRVIWFGTDANTIGRARLPAR
ncbi:MAG: lyase [Gemmatimonadota bacterium]